MNFREFMKNFGTGSLLPSYGMTPALASCLCMTTAGCPSNPVEERHTDKEKTQPQKHGMLCLTFDDGLYQEWLQQMELFRRHHARATFFYSGEITQEAADSMRILRRNGHSIGLHSLTHRDCTGEDMPRYFDEEIRPQLDAAKKYGISDIRYFAYPNNRHTDESDQFLSRYFSRFRVGTGLKLPKGFWIAEQETIFMSLQEIKGKKAIGGCGIGEYYLSTVENLDAALRKAAEDNKLIVFFSHGISPHAQHVHMPLELLEHLLDYASELQMDIAGFDELNYLLTP